MSQRSIATIWSEMELEHKVNSVGSGLMILSLFFQWYTDFDSFGSGDVYNGFNGPMYFAGMSLFIGAVISLSFSVFHTLKGGFWQKRFRNKSWGTAQFWVGIFSFYLLFLINSAYFHPKFGLNITLKESGLGILLAMIAAGLMTVGGFFASRERKNEVEKFQSHIKKQVKRETAAGSNLAPRVIQDQQLRKSLAGLGKQIGNQGNLSNKGQEVSNDAPLEYQTQARQTNAAVQNSNVQSAKKTQPYRMDL